MMLISHRNPYRGQTVWMDTHAGWSQGDLHRPRKLCDSIYHWSHQPEEKPIRRQFLWYPEPKDHFQVKCFQGNSKTTGSKRQRSLLSIARLPRYREIHIMLGIMLHEVVLRFSIWFYFCLLLPKFISRCGSLERWKDKCNSLLETYCATYHGCYYFKSA